MCVCQQRIDEHTLNCLKLMCEYQKSYNALSCFCPRLGDRMLSMFCLTASYSRIHFFMLPYLAYSRSFSSDSMEYSSRSLARSGSLSPTPDAFSARADASKRMISRSRPRRYFSLWQTAAFFQTQGLRFPRHSQTWTPAAYRRSLQDQRYNQWLFSGCF